MGRLMAGIPNRRPTLGHVDGDLLPRSTCTAKRKKLRFALGAGFGDSYCKQMQPTDRHVCSSTGTPVHSATGNLWRTHYDKLPTWSC